MPIQSPIVRDFLNMWLEGESSADVLDWLIDNDLVDKAGLKRLLMEVYHKHKGDPDMKELAKQAKQAADAL